jgi:hypothetical protein
MKTHGLSMLIEGRGSLGAGEADNQTTAMVLYSDTSESVEWINMCWRKVRWAFCPNVWFAPAPLLPVHAQLHQLVAGFASPSCAAGVPVGGVPAKLPTSHSLGSPSHPLLTVLSGERHLNRDLLSCMCLEE